MFIQIISAYVVIFLSGSYLSHTYMNVCFSIDRKIDTYI